MVIYLFLACDIYSYTWKDTSILLIVYILMKHPNASKLSCDIPYLFGSDFEIHRSVHDVGLISSILMEVII